MNRDTRIYFENQNQRSEVAMKWLCLWALVLAGGTFRIIYLAWVWWNDKEPLDSMTVLVPSFAIIFGLTFTSIMIFRYQRINYQMWDRWDRQKPPDMPTHNSPMFESDTRRPAIGLSTQTSTNTLELLPFKFEPAQWGKLVNILVANSEGSTWKWNKEILRKSGLFVESITPNYSITRGGDYARICNEFERLRIIGGGMSNWVVTDFGKAKLSLEGAKLPVIPGRG